MNLFAHFQTLIEQALGAMAEAGEIPAGLDFARVTAEPPRDPAHGDIATNAAMVLAKPAGMAPRQLADKLAKRLAATQDVAQVDVAGPGFINLKLKASFWPKLLAAALELGDAYGR